jgi:hypothetical protein
MVRVRACVKQAMACDEVPTFRRLTDERTPKPRCAAIRGENPKSVTVIGRRKRVMNTADALRVELETYERRKAELLQQGEGRFVLIQDSEVAGIWDNYEDALKAGYEKYGLRPFLVKQIRAVERVQFVSRVD